MEDKTKTLTLPDGPPANDPEDGDVTTLEDEEALLIAELDDPEQAELDAYLDQGMRELPRKDVLEFRRARYQIIQNEYKAICLQLMEAEQTGDKASQAKLRDQVRKNWKSRYVTVLALRKLGVDVEDEHVKTGKGK